MNVLARIHVPDANDPAFGQAGKLASYALTGGSARLAS
jgi:hypothetical protein